MKEEYNTQLNQYKQEDRTIVYTDESGFYDHDMSRIYGYSIKGIRCYGLYDWHPKKRSNVIGALLNNKLLTVGIYKQNINSKIFEEWLRDYLIPCLPVRSVVVMDNASFHKKAIIREILEAAGHVLLYLPTYSPELNPIEPKWAQCKGVRRKYGCSVEELFSGEHGL